MNEAPIPDGTLLRRYREGGDQAAFAELRRRHGRLVFATCRRETGDAALAEDAAQGVFLLLIRKSFDERASVAGWLHGAARLVSRNVVREEGRRRWRERQAHEEVPEAGWNEVSPHIDVALAGLRPLDREAVLLRFAGDLSLAEVGQTLGMGENAARMRIARALEKMRGHLRRAGVGISVLLLASLLSTRIADADGPLPDVGSPSQRARRLARRALPWTFLPVPATMTLGVASLALLALLTGGLAVRFAPSRPSRLDAKATGELLHSAEGAWRGTLEYADDLSGKRTKTGVTVSIDRPGGGLRLVSRYPSYKNVDTTTFTPLPDGRFTIVNGGTGSSHRLDGAYDLVRLPDGTPAFVGFSLAVRTEVRLRLVTTAGSLTLQEEVRREDGYRFRNRFDLRRP